MFGITLHITCPNISLILRPLVRDEVAVLVKYWNSYRVHLNTNGMFGQTLENELEWYERTRQDKDSCTWAIQPTQETEPVGITSLHHLNDRDGGCSSGIIIFRQDWWGKGVASAAHLGRTLFAADNLHRTMIHSSVRSENPASLKALQRVGYSVWGTESCSVFRQNHWLSTHHLTWFHPDHETSFFPDDTPDNYKEGFKNAAKSLQLAREVVIYP